ncbi:MAG: hypothetical protein IT486_09445 [Gammaproteobacteria bacterium]|nr:hypothetical protein [Gammaproteobacteria bacterium]
MSPIEQVKPPLPGNWVRRPEPKLRRGGGKSAPRQDRGDRNRPGHDPGPDPGQDPGHDPGEREHIVDELA